MIATPEDLELLMQAAKAAGYNFRGYEKWYEDYVCYDPETDCNYQWNPLARNQDAFELAVVLKITVSLFETDVETTRFNSGATFMEVYGDDAEAAVRRAIVRYAEYLARKLK
jgi:hypothetical protein